MKKIVMAVVSIVILILGAALYVKHLSDKATQYATEVLFLPTTSVGEVVNRLQDAPPMECDLHAQDGGATIWSKAYVAEGKMRIDTLQGSGTVANHGFINLSGLVLWKDGDTTSLRVPTDTIYSFYQYSSISCSLWWPPDMSVFSFPPTKDQ